MSWKPSAPATGQIWGAGWGGEPKGFTSKPARGGPPKPWTDPSARGREIWSAMSAEERAERRALAATKEAQMAQMREVWGDVALNGESEMARIAAARTSATTTGANLRKPNAHNNSTPTATPQTLQFPS